jgi:hypothetical protein
MKSALYLLSVALLLVGCGREKTSTAASRFPVGTWVCEFDYPNGSHFKSTTVVSSGGRYLCHGTSTGTNNISRSFELEGSWEIRDGFLIDTMTKHSQTNAPVPTTSRAQIIRRSDSELVTKWEGMENESVLRKVK